MKATVAARSGGGEWRRVLVVALLLAFVLQTQLAATHFHLVGSSKAATLTQDGQAGPAKDQKKAPADSDCPICQQLAGAHNVLIYVAVALSLPELIATKQVAPPDERAPLPLLAPHWQSRAPPL